MKFALNFQEAASIALSKNSKDARYQEAINVYVDNVDEKLARLAFIQAIGALESSKSTTPAKEEKSMGKSLDTENKPKVGVADVVQYGEKLILPTDMKIPEAIDLLQRRQKYLAEKVIHKASFKVFPWDGAWVFADVLKQRYGWAPGEPIPQFFMGMKVGENPPEVMQIESGVGKSVDVPWGDFSIPGTSIVVRTGGTFQGDDLAFTLSGNCNRDDEATLKALFEDVRLAVQNNSLYRGKAITIQFNDINSGEAISIPVISFMSTDIDETKVVYSAPVQAMIETSLFTPIRRVADLEANGIPFKSGVLLGGPFGTGKTLAARVAAKLCEEHGITFIYIRRADEIVRAIQFARLYYQSAAVVFCEDIDRVTSNKRDAVFDNILNTIDGIDAKSTRVMVVATTNELESINPAILRPGRMDAVIVVTPPDAEAVQKLIRVYAGDTLPTSEDLTAAGEALAGQIPAVIAEVVQRAKKVQLKFLKPGELIKGLTGQAITESAETIRQQVELLKPKEVAPTDTLDAHMKSLVTESLQKVRGVQDQTLRTVKEVKTAVVG